MKFQKGLLTGTEAAKPFAPAADRPADPPPTPVAAERVNRAPIVVERDRLFDTVSETRRSGRKYVVVLLAVGVAIGAAASAAWYAMRPGPGDRVTAPRGLELALRNHFLEKEKRVATDIAFHLCDGFYWAKVGVETRTDLPNPLFRVDTYAASARPSEDAWSITARPAPSAETQVPCS